MDTKLSDKHLFRGYFHQGDAYMKKLLVKMLILGGLVLSVGSAFPQSTKFDGGGPIPLCYPKPGEPCPNGN